MKLLPLSMERVYHIRYGSDVGLRLRVERTFSRVQFEWQRSVVIRAAYTFAGTTHPELTRWVSHRLAGPKSIIVWHNPKSVARYYGIHAPKEPSLSKLTSLTQTEEDLKNNYQIEVIDRPPWFVTAVDAFIFIQAMEAVDFD